MIKSPEWNKTDIPVVNDIDIVKLKKCCPIELPYNGFGRKVDDKVIKLNVTPNIVLNYLAFVNSTECNSIYSLFASGVMRGIENEFIYKVDDIHSRMEHKSMLETMCHIIDERPDDIPINYGGVIKYDVIETMHGYGLEITLK